jgi:molybdenum cofactor synthesis domain-containing protein
MTVEIVSIGTELLLGQVVDTNAAWLSARLAEIGVGVYRRMTVGDNRERIIQALRDALARAEGVITIGGWDRPTTTSRARRLPPCWASRLCWTRVRQRA